MQREGAELGLFVTQAPPTKPMEVEAASAGRYDSRLFGDAPRIQILTIEGLLSGTERARYPDLSRGGHTFKRARAEMEVVEQKPLP